MLPGRHGDFFSLLLKRMHTVVDYHGLIIDQEPCAIVRADEEQILARLHDINRGLEPQAKMIAAAGNAEIEVLRVPNGDWRELAKVRQLLPIALVIGVLNPGD